MRASFTSGYVTLSLCEKMASDLEGSSFSSPPKRLKLDNPSVLCNRSSEIDSVSYAASFSAPESTGKREVGVSSELKRKSPDDSEEPAKTGIEDDQNESRDGGLDEEDDDVSSTVSNLSDLSGLSDMSGQDWKPIAGPMSWVQKQMLNRVNPRTLLSHMMGDNSHVPEQVDDLTLWKVIDQIRNVEIADSYSRSYSNIPWLPSVWQRMKVFFKKNEIIVNILSEPPRRSRLRNVNTLNDVIHLLNTCSRIIVLTGAGVSVSCGIPDFRSRNGIYSRLAVDFPNLPDPQAMFDINFFRQDPRPFFKFAREIYPGLFKPSPCHRFIKMLEKQKKLLRNYTQNIDTLEQVAGIENVIECHGSFATASCTVCRHKVTAEDIRADVFHQKIPYCPVCPAGSELSRGLLKPDIVFFGEGLPDSFHSAMASDKDACDLLIVIGSSLKVRPVALIPSSIPNKVPQILINRERLPHLNFDVELYGDSDIIIDQICHMLGGSWSEVRWRDTPLTETSHLLSPPSRCGFTSDYGKSDSESHEAEREMSVDSGPPEDHEMEDQPPSNDTAVCLDDSCREPQRVGRVKRSPVDIEEGMSVEVETHETERDEGGDRALVSRRHLSLDSTRDSGIGDGSNSSHSGAGDRHMSVESDGGSLAHRLPDNTYFHVQPNRYVFPGAEVPDETEEEDNSSVADLSEVESENETTLGQESDTWASQ